MMSAFDRQTNKAFLAHLPSHAWRMVRLVVQWVSLCWLAMACLLLAKPAVAETASLPDLTVSVPVVGAVVRNANGSYTFPVSFVVTNAGPVTAPASTWYDIAYLSSNGVLDAASVWIGYLAHNTAVAPGASYTVSQTYTTSAAPGNYTLIVKADGNSPGITGGSNTDNGRLPESNETNNTQTAAVALKLPDLTVSTPEVGTVVRNSNGSYTFPVSFVVTNAGAATAPASNWYDIVYLSSNGVLDTASSYVGYLSHNTALAPGASYTVSQTYTTSAAPGNYTLIVKADGNSPSVDGQSNTNNGWLPESNETNNTQTVALALTPPDLLASAPIIGTITRNSDGSYSIPVSFTVTNTGAIAAPATNWYDVVYLSKNGVLDGNSVALNYMSHTAAVAAGDSYTVSQIYTTPSLTALGDNTLIIKADGSHPYYTGGSNTDNGRLVESNEANNTQSVLLPLSSFADLVIDNPSLGVIVRNGDGSYNIPVSFTVTNNGVALAASNWYDVVYLSKNGVLDANSVPLNYQSHTTALARGESYTVSQTYRTPVFGALSDYTTVIMKADGSHPYYTGGSNTDNGRVVETDETNNTQSVPLPVSTFADLAVSAARVGEIVRNADGSYNIPVSFTVTNTGAPLSASNWYDVVYLARNGVLDANSVPLNYKSHGTALAHGESYTVSQTFKTPVLSTLSDYTVIVKADGSYPYYTGGSNTDNGRVVETDEINNTQSVLLPVTTFADLAVSNVSVGTIVRNANGSYNIPVSFIVTNTGAPLSASNWYDVVYLARNGVLDANSVPLNYKSHGTALAHGDSYTVNQTYTVATLTDYTTLIVKADGSYPYYTGGSNTDNGRVAESNEINNVQAVTLAQTTFPDLAVSAPVIGAIGVNPNGSYTIPVSFTVTNNGSTTAAPDWYDVGYLSANGLLDAASVALGNTNHPTELISGASYTVTQTYTTATTVVAGKYTLIVKADGRGGAIGGSNIDNGQLAEANETNNTQAIGLTLPTLADLTVSVPVVGTIVANHNGSYTIPVSFTVTNNGTSTALARWYDLGYLSANGVLDAASVPLGYAYRSTDLAPGASYKVTQTYTTATSAAAGNYTLVVKADGRGGSVGGSNTDNGALIEANESNNTQVVTMTLPTLADLAVSVPVVGTIVANANGSFNIPVSFTVTNNGTSAAPPSWYDLGYLSSNGVLDAASVVLGNTNHTSSLAPGASYTVTQTYTTSTTVVPGNYTLVVKADGHGSGVGGTNLDNGQLAESNESNNTQTVALTLPTLADLSVSTPVIGTIVANANGSYNIPVSFTVTNNGTSAAPPSWYDLGYLSTNGLLDTASVVLGYTNHTTTLTPGASYTVTQTYTTSTTVVPGNYTLIVKADGHGSGVGGSNTDNGALLEANESNNTQAVALTLPTLADLTISVPVIGTIVANANGSYNIPVSFTVTNNGTSAAQPSWYDLGYLSANSVLDAASVVFGYTHHTTTLAPSASYTVTQTYTTSTTVVPGNYTLIVKADGHGAQVGGSNTDNGQVAEANESNNTQAVTVTLPTLADLSVSTPVIGTIVANANGSYNIPVSFTVTNNGTSAALANWYDLGYLSTNGVLDAASVVFGYTHHTATLAPSASYTVTQTYTTSTTLVPGNYTLFVKADGHGGPVGGSNTDNGQVAEANESNNTQSRTVTLSRAIPEPDLEGPQLSSINANGIALADGVTLTRNGSITLSATDRSGIARIDVLLDGVVISSASGSGSYAAPLNLDNVANGAHTIALRATDSVGNVTTNSYAITVAHSAPDAPLIAQPANGLTTRSSSVTVSGSAKPGSSVQLLLGGRSAGAALTAGLDGRFAGNLTLANGTNQIQATATDAYGTSVASTVVSITLDASVPASPTNLTAAAQTAGKVRLTWARSTDPHAISYDVYRAPNPFAAITEATKINSSTLTATAFDDLPSQDAAWTYRVVSVNAAATPSLPSNAAQATSDSLAPKALSIVYTPLGKIDPQSGRIGQGRVNLVLATSEALPSAPYLAMVPQGGAPIAVDLQATGPTSYSGSFLIDANTPSGVANALFSARDAVGNRGTDVASGTSLRIDTQGPELSSIVVTPAAPINNQGAPTISATFTFSKAPKVVPQVKFKLSGSGRSAEPVGNLSTVNATTYTASFTLPTDAGLAAPENLSFSFQAQDDLDNISTRVTGVNRFQVYQGDLPPLLNPFGFTAKAQPGGKVKLTWQAVEEAVAYQLYRQAPGQSALQALARVGGLEYMDATTQDGNYKYAVASIRQSNGQETVSVFGAVLDVRALATRPTAPQSLNLQLTGQGIYASWQAAIGPNIDYYNLYRASGTVITSIEGLTPIKTRIKNAVTYDTNPSPTQGAYVVTAVDTAGNESPISNSAYLNASLLPVRNLQVTQTGNELPQLTWQAPNGNLAGYLVYVTNGNTRSKLTPSLITSTSFTDTGYAGGERLYSVVAVDSAQVELARNILLPRVSSQIISGLPLKRGVMNKLQVEVTNTSSITLGGVQAVVRLPIDRAATQFKEHRSEAVTLSPNQTWVLPVVVGGYADLPGNVAADVGVEIVGEDDKVKLARSQNFDVNEGALVVGMATSEFTRGATGKLKLTIENTSEVEIELLTATNNGANDSSELRFKLLDSDGNVLATQPYKQILGSNVITMPNGQTVARIAAGSNFTSEEFSLNIPAASPNSIRVRLEVDKLRYHSGKADEVQINGRGSERSVSLLDTAYYGEVTNVTPLSSYGDQDIIISGRAIERNTNNPLPNTRLKLVLNQQGFERNLVALTDSSGNFAHRFQPTLGDSGHYRVSAVHPDITDRPEQKSFTINRVTVGPSPYKLDLPKGASFTIPLVGRAGPGTVATNLRLTLDAASQPTGRIPAGISLDLPHPDNVSSGQSLNMPVIFRSTQEAEPSGSVILNVISDEHANTPIGQVRINYTLSEARPYLVATPNLVESGLALGSSQIESVSIKNNGLSEALNLQFSLTKPDNSAAPAWATIASAANGTLAVGATRSIDLQFAPGNEVQEGVYEMRLNLRGDNIPNQSLNVYVSVTANGQGSVLFKASDIYTATLDTNGNLIKGLANANITLQNEEVATVSYALNTDNLGEAFFRDVPAGRYKFRAKANNHQEVAGRMTVRPGISLTQPVFLDYNLITVEWSVREVTIQDRYDITLNATFETNVPAAVVMMQPASVNLPKMNSGDVFYGEIVLTNFGLVEAKKVRQQLPASDANFRYEFLVELPDTLAAKQRITIPYRVIALQALGSASSNGFASGGGCHNYSNRTAVTCEYSCANGNVTTCGSSTSFFSYSNSTCPSGSSGGGGGGGGGGWGGGSGNVGGIGGSPSTTMHLEGEKCVYIPKGECKNGCPGQ